mgnify:CR=1 FL=1
MSRSVEALGGVDGFVHAAGAVSPDPLGSLTDENWRRVVDVNLTAFPFVVQALLEPLRVAAAAAAVEGSASTGPGVVGISSIEGLVGNAAIPAYCASKSGLLGVTRALAHQLGPEGIRVNAVCPGFVETPLTQQNAFTMPALITPEQAAIEILRGWARGRFDIHFPKRFTRWLKLLRLLPYRLYFAAVSRFTGL